MQQQTHSCAFLNSWLKELSNHMQANTMQHYMINARSFLKHMRDNPPPGTKLSRRTVMGLVTFFDRMLKSNKKPVTLRRHEVKIQKRQCIHSQQDLKTCLLQCREKIPKVLGEFTLGFDKI